jgi:exodeoxyribonuclease VII large subunit
MELMAQLPMRLRRTIHGQLDRAGTDVSSTRDRIDRRMRGLLENAGSDLEHVRARIRALSPQATLERGYAVVQRADGAVVRAPDDAIGLLRVRVAGGEFGARAQS